jgi:hypothetical protein
MIATLTIGKRRAGIPSERGSIEPSLLAPSFPCIGEIADALRETGKCGFPAKGQQARRFRSGDYRVTV